MKNIAGFVVVIAAILLASDALAEGGSKIYDVVVYGGTSAGVAAAVQVRRLGKTVVLVESSRRLGGLTTGGLGQTDIGNKAAIGGIAREFYQRVANTTIRPPHGSGRRPRSISAGGQTRTARPRQRCGPSSPVRRRSSTIWSAEAGVEVIYGERLDRKKGVTKDGPRIVAIAMESGRALSRSSVHRRHLRRRPDGRGGVSYAIGREANAELRRNAQRRPGEAAINAPIHPRSIPT